MRDHARLSQVATIVLLLSATATLAQDAVTVDLAWRTGSACPTAWLTLPLSNQPPEGVDPLPDRPGVRYGRVDLADDWSLLYALETTEEASTVRVDRDRDGSLADETGLALEGTPYSLGVTAYVEFEGGPTVPFRFRYRPKARDGRFHVQPIAHLEGEIVVAGRARLVIARDHTGDLRVDDAKDTIHLDLDGDGSVDESEGSNERVVPGRYFRLGARGFSVRLLAPSGRRLGFDSVSDVPPPPLPRWPVKRVPPTGIEAKGAALTRERIDEMYEKAAKRDRELPPAASTSTRRSLMRTIGRSPSKDATRFLLRIARAERSADLRAAAVRGLGYRQHLAAAEQVRGIARNDRDANVQRAALQALHEMGDPGRVSAYVSVLAGTRNETVATCAASNLAWVGTEEADRKLGEAIAGLQKAEFRVVAYRAATRFRAKPPPADLVRRAAGSDSPDLRALALADARVLGLPDVRDLALASVALAARTPDLAREVVEVLGRISDTACVEALLTLVPTLPLATRTRLVALLAPIREPAATKVLLDALDDREETRRSVAAAAAARIPGAATREALLRRLPREDDRVALTSIVEGLGRLRAIEAVGGIVQQARRHKSDRDFESVALEALVRIDLVHDEVRSFLSSCLASKAVEDRILALDALGGAHETEPAADLILPLLDDDKWAVRLTAVQGLGRQRVAKAVAPLIARLGEEKQGRVRRALVETLFRITGADLGDVVESWRRWWEKHGEGFVVPRAVPERPPRRDDGTVTARFYGIPIGSDRVVFVLDKSGSMIRPSGSGKDSLDRAVDETLAAVAKLRSGSRVNAVLFDDETHAWQRKLTKITKSSLVGLTKYLREKEPGGSTNLYDALELALLTKDVDTVVVLSDGLPNVGRFYREAQFLREVRRINRFRRIVIHTVSLGRSTDLMRSLSREHGGIHVRR